MGDVDDGSFVPSGPDAGHPASELFGPCVEDYQCPGRGGFCRKPADGYPLGTCSKTCDDRTVCEAYGTWNWCLPDETGRKTCVQKCLNGVDCSRPGYTCTGDIAGGAGSCYPLCTGDQCGPTAECHAESGRCFAPGALPKNKAANGAPCRANEDCGSGRCSPEVRDGKATGWLEGMCIGPCVLPAGWNNNTIFAGDTLPPGTCPGDMVCYPDSALERGEPGTCRPACVEDSDCRTGYACLKKLGAKEFTNGFCLPVDCSERDCPAGTMCKLNGTGYVCTRN